jgi:hypothetical protein
MNRHVPDPPIGSGRIAHPKECPSMFASITCPACRHKYTIPEGQMGSRQNCPNCRTPFLAGKSVAEGSAAEVPMKYEPAPVPGLNKTMLAETEQPIRYNCPRCKKPLESPVSEAGTKKPCPSCGQRLQVPAPPPPPAQPPGLNKTMLASSEPNPPATSIAPGLPTSSVSAAPPAPAAPASPWSRRLALAAGALAGCVFLLLCSCLILAFVAGPSQADRDKMAQAQKQVEDAKRELEELKRSIKDRETSLAQQKQLEAQFEQMMAKIREREEKLSRQAELDREAYRNDQQKAAEAKKAADERQRELAEERARAAKNEQEAKASLAKLQGELEALKQRQQQATTVVTQPPPVIYSYPPYHPYRYWPFGW